MDREELADLVAAQTLSLVNETHQLETERDNAILERDKAFDLANDAIGIAERVMSGHAVERSAIDRLKERFIAI